MIESTGMIRQLDELGRVVIPAEARNRLGIAIPSGLEVLIDEANERIILQKAVQQCFKCDSRENLKKVKPGYYLCQNCIQSLQ